MDYTLTGLYASIRRRASLPSSATVGTANADLLAYINEELRLRLTADIMRVREEYFVRRQTTTLSASTTSYRVPTRAIGGTVRYVALLDSAGAVLGGLPRVEPEQVEDFSAGTSLSGFVLRGNRLIMVPSSSSSATSLGIDYCERPNEIVAVAQGVALAITAINTSTKVVTTATHSFTTSSVLDMVSATPGFESHAIDQTPTATTSTTMTFSSLPSDLAVGDYVCLAKQSPVPQIPEEFHPILAQRVALKCLQAMGAGEQVKEAKDELEKMEKAAGLLIAPRTTGNPQKIINRHGALGPARGSSFTSS